MPFIAWWPGTIQAGSVADHPSAFWDFLPTACELAGVEPAETDGISYLPTLLGRPQKRHELLYWQYKGKQAGRHGKWKVVRSGPQRPLELYDLEADVGETKDLAAERTAVVARIEILLANAKSGGGR